jgi:mono/diheme cytochrome c family protein/heme/copper-type cytochrome/quinol oxidase subunit 4
MAHDSNDHKNHGIMPYVVVGVILAVITYIEFAIIEYEIPFLGDAATLWWLMILSVAKFVMVIMYFMHLKDDEFTYSGFFGSGMVIGLGTFIAFAFLMTAPASLDYVRAQMAPDGRFVHGGGHGGDEGYGHDQGLPDATVALIESDGYSRELDAILTAGRPKDQSWRVTPPSAATGGWTLASAAPMPAAAPAPAATSDGAAAPTGPAGPGTPAAPSEPAAQQAAGGWDEALGQQVYAANCASCHQATGAGIPGAFPPLAGHAPELVSVDGGRTFLVDALLYGLQGQISVAGTTYNGVMPAWGFLSDEQIAAVANHVLYSWDNDADLPDGFAPITPDEVADERGKGWTGADVHDLRTDLDLP